MSSISSDSRGAAIAHAFEQHAALDAETRDSLSVSSGSTSSSSGSYRPRLPIGRMPLPSRASNAAIDLKNPPANSPYHRLSEGLTHWMSAHSPFSPTSQELLSRATSGSQLEASRSISGSTALSPEPHFLGLPPTRDTAASLGSGERIMKLKLEKNQSILSAPVELVEKGLSAVTGFFKDLAASASSPSNSSSSAANGTDSNSSSTFSIFRSTSLSTVTVSTSTQQIPPHSRSRSDAISPSARSRYLESAAKEAEQIFASDKPDDGTTDEVNGEEPLPSGSLQSVFNALEESDSPSPEIEPVSPIQETQITEPQRDESLHFTFVMPHFTIDESEEYLNDESRDGFAADDASLSPSRSEKASRNRSHSVYRVTFERTPSSSSSPSSPSYGKQSAFVVKVENDGVTPPPPPPPAPSAAAASHTTSTSIAAKSSTTAAASSTSASSSTSAVATVTDLNSPPSTVAVRSPSTDMHPSQNMWDLASRNIDLSFFDSLASYGFPDLTPEKFEWLQRYAKRLEEQERAWDAVQSSSTELASLTDKQYKRLTRQGVPAAYRARVWWFWLAPDALKSSLPLNYYTDLVTRAEAGEIDGEINRTIHKDVDRTFITHPFYRDPTGPGVNALRRILQAYAMRNPNIGYCQSMNFLAAFLLLFYEEEDSFWMLVRMLEELLPCDYYTPTMLGVLTDVQLLLLLLPKKLPQIWNHLKKMECVSSLEGVFTSWFLCLFIRTTPVETALRILDSLFVEGTKILFRVALALMSLHEEQILACEEFGAVFQLFTKMGHNQYDCDRLMNRAFELKSIKRTWIEKQRKSQRAVLTKQLEEMEAKRRQSL